MKSAKHFVPFEKHQEKNSGEGFYYKGIEYVHHGTLKHHETAFERLTYRQGLLIGGFAIVVIAALVADWHATLVAIVACLTLLYFFDLLFNLFLIVRSYKKIPEITITSEEIAATPKKSWPTYTILCPLFHEKDILPLFTKALSHLDYDHSKLQILLLLEEDDTETIAAAKQIKGLPHLEVVVIPKTTPQTKPKACNYGLKKATGEYVVIYDAEDVPEPLQLKKAYLAFQKAGSDVACLQGKLDFYNPHHNMLTKVFTAEYALWFDLVLTGLQSIHAPIPLGGTSNHFRTKQLKALGGWDSFNVTEDADLGMRLARRGYSTAILNSRTMEEANSNVKNWFGQRRRWVKGYLQTYLVHTREFRAFRDSKKQVRDSITMRLVLGGKVFSMLINPFFWILTILYFVFRPSIGTTIEGFYPLTILYIGALTLVFGNFLYMYYYMLGCAKRGYYDLIKYVFLVPVYWLMMSAAAWAAVYELLVNPYYWNKTKHGLFLSIEKAVNEVEGVLAKDTGTLGDDK